MGKSKKKLIGRSTIKLCANVVPVKYRNKFRGTTRHIATDSTGLKVFSEGEWKVRAWCRKMQSIVQTALSC